MKAKKKPRDNSKSEDLRRYKIVVKFDLDEVDGEKSDFKEMRLKTKPVTFERAKNIMKSEADKIWPYYEYEISPI